MRLFSFILCILLCVSLSSCSSEGISTRDVLDAIMESCPSLPAGDIYSSLAGEGEDGFMPDSVALAMYGDDCDKLSSLVEEYSIYLSSFEAPYEIAVLKCYAKSDARDIWFTCLARADTIRVALRGTDFYGLCDDVRVIREGRYVIMLLVDSPDEAQRTALGLIG